MVVGALLVTGVVALLDGLVVEQRRHLGHRQGVVVRGDRDVLLVGTELVAELLVEACGEGG